MDNNNTKSYFTNSELSIVLNGYEKQASRLFKIILLLLVSNAIFIFLYFTEPQTVTIGSKQNKAMYADQTVNS